MELSQIMQITEAHIRFCAFMVRLNYSPLTVKKGSYLLRRFEKHIGDTPLEELSYQQLTQFVDLIGARVTVKTRANHIGLLRSFGRFLQEEEDLIFAGKSNPFLRLRAPKIPIRVPRAPESVDLVNALKGPFLRKGRIPANAYQLWMNQRNAVLLFSFAILGPRNSECCGLCWKNVCLTDNPYLIVRGKGDKERIIPLPPDLVRQYVALKMLEGERGRGDLLDPVFVTHPHNNPARPGQAMTGQTAREIARDILKDKLPGFDRGTPQLLRRAALTALVESGADIVTIAAIAGHQSLEHLFRNYVAQRDKRKAAAIANSPLALCAKVDTSVLKEV